MAAILIDGHNVIGQMPDISLADPDDEDKLVRKLSAHFERVRGRVVVVFDAGPNPPIDALPPPRGRIEVVFSRPPEKADDVIMRLITSDPNPKHLTVISGDREILACANRRRCRIIRSEAFVRELERGPLRPKRRRAAQPELAGEIASETYLNYWYEFFDVPEHERE